MFSSFQSPGEVAFTIFQFPVYYYGIILSIAILAGFFTAYTLYKKFYDTERAGFLVDFAPFLILFGILGARIYYCLVNYSYYVVHPLEIFNIRQGGLSVHGMIIAGVIALYIYAKKYKLSFKQLADVFLCGSILAQSIGRWGNFFNSEAFGLPTNLPWKLYIPVSHRPFVYLNNDYFHPTFLYESILDFIIFIVLLLLFKKLSKIPGMTACLYLIFYSLVRIFIEQLRIDSVLNVFGFPIAQIISITMFVIGIGLMYKINYKS